MNLIFEYSVFVCLFLLTFKIFGWKFIKLRNKMSSTKTKAVKPPQPPKPVNLNLNLKLNRFVYTKYRAMLGSYNDKANEIIQSLPSKKAIFQQMDRHFSLVTIKKSSPWVLHILCGVCVPRMEWIKIYKKKICCKNKFGVLWAQVLILWVDK